MEKAAAQIVKLLWRRSYGKIGEMWREFGVFGGWILITRLRSLSAGKRC